jgi:hypothetical protein
MPRIDGASGVTVNDREIPFYQWDIHLTEYNRGENRIKFGIRHESDSALVAEYELKIGEHLPNGHAISKIGGVVVRLQFGRTLVNLEEFFNDYVPPLTFVDQSVLEGCELIEITEQPAGFSTNQAEALEWPGVDLRKESFLKNGNWRQDSIQAFAIQKCRSEGFQILFDDDGANEIADLVAIRDAGSQITIRLVHCKYSAVDRPGGRVEDIVEVSSQVVKNAHWFWNIARLAKRMFLRNKDRAAMGYPRFLSGSPELMRKVTRLNELSVSTVREVVVVQPGLSKSAMTTQISSILGSADSYLRMAAGCPLRVWCST